MHSQYQHDNTVKQEMLGLLYTKNRIHHSTLRQL